MIGGGINHFLNPVPYLKIIPPFLPAQMMIVYLSGLLEIALAVGLLLNKSLARKAAFAVFILMLIFLPLHFWDIFRPVPAIGSHTLAYIRFALQIIFVYLSYKLYKKYCQL